MRERAGLTQAEAASEAGLNRNTIIALETNAAYDPKLSTLLALVRIYGLNSVEELLGPMPSARLANTVVQKERTEP